MSSAQRPAVILLIFLIAGCRSTGDMDLIQRELRLQEDRIYELEDYIEQYQHMLEACEREKQRLERELGDDGRKPPAAETVPPDAPAEGGIDIEMPGAPDVEFGTEFTPGAPAADLPGTTGKPDEKPAPSVPQQRRRPESEQPSTAPGPVLPEPGELPLPGADVKEGEVSKLVFVPSLTGVWRDGDRTGLLALVEPQSVDGEIVLPAGEFSLMAVDPNGGGVQAPLGRWDFSAGQARTMWHRSEDGEGLYFELDWPGEPPQAESLRLYVRVLQADQAKVLGETEISTSDPINLQAVKAAEQRWSRQQGTRGRNTPPSRMARSQWDLQPIRIPEEGESSHRFRPARRQAEPERDSAQSRPRLERAPQAEPEPALSARPKWSPYR